MCKSRGRASWAEFQLGWSKVIGRKKIIEVELCRTLQTMVRSLCFIPSTMGNYWFNYCFKKTPMYRALKKIEVSLSCNNLVQSQ